eukprot:TRINITY_DN8670_c0_g5_i1.p3 TRINITY_DN8670_c0_g5~~TRINITY_DN8670_c0_g5_i1.p3  ORF type:complete len:344 (+),score=122.91 TRINITY_DN8670_c0_g5_i1:61-1092(+)
MGCCPTSAANSPTDESQGRRRDSQNRSTRGRTKQQQQQQQRRQQQRQPKQQQQKLKPQQQQQQLQQQQQQQQASPPLQRKGSADPQPGNGEKRASATAGGKAGNGSRRSGDRKTLPGDPPGAPAAKAPLSSELVAAFDQCLGADPQQGSAEDVLVSPSQFEALASVLQLRGPEDPGLLAALHLLKGDEGLPWTLSKAEWSRGWCREGVRTLGEARASVVEAAAAMSDRKSDRFRRIYLFVFGFVQAQDSSKTLDAEVAVEYWELLLADWQWIGRWNDFWREQLKRPKGRRGVTRDEWAQLLEFSKDANAMESADTALSAWPSVIDDFIEWNAAAAPGTAPACE